jgi:hypothetical protein
MKKHTDNAVKRNKKKKANNIDRSLETKINYFVTVPRDIIIHLTKYLKQQDVNTLYTVSKQFKNDLIPLIIYDNKSMMSLNNSDRKKIRKFILRHNSPLPTKLWDAITSLILDDLYDKPLPCNLPGALTSLTFGRNYNQPLPRLPNTLTSLTFGSCYDQPLPGLPNALTSLTFGWCYNQPLPELPNALTSLTLGLCYNHPLPENLSNITSLTLGWAYNYPLSDKQLKKLSSLTVNIHYGHPLPKKLPNGSIIMDPLYGFNLVMIIGRQ